MMGLVAFSTNWLGIPPCWRAYFLLLRQKKVAKEKATPGSAPATPVPCATRHVGRLRNSGYALRQSSPKAPDVPALLSASHGDPGEPSTTNGSAAYSACSPRQEHSLILGLSVNRETPFGVPMRGAEQRRCWRKKGEDCLRAQPEFRSPRQRRVAQGTGVAGADPGVAFFLATFSWRSKKKYARQQGGTPSPFSKLCFNREPSGFQAAQP